MEMWIVLMIRTSFSRINQARIVTGSLKSPGNYVIGIRKASQFGLTAQKPVDTAETGGNGASKHFSFAT